MPRSFKTYDEKPEKENAPIEHKVKDRGGGSVAKAHAIAGYLRRRMLKESKTAKYQAKLSSTKTMKPSDGASNDVGCDNSNIVCRNKFILVEDELDSAGECLEQENEASGGISGTSESTVRETGLNQSRSRRKSKSSATSEMDCGEVTCIDSEQKTTLGPIPAGQSTEFHEIPLPSFNKARALRDKKSRKTYTALTYYLKCKHFMHTKDPHFIRTLVQDARAWLIRGQFKMETYQEFVILTSAIS